MKTYVRSGLSHVLMNMSGMRACNNLPPAVSIVYHYKYSIQQLFARLTFKYCNPISVEYIEEAGMKRDFADIEESIIKPPLFTCVTLTPTPPFSLTPVAWY